VQHTPTDAYHANLPQKGSRWRIGKITRISTLQTSHANALSEGGKDDQEKATPFYAAAERLRQTDETVPLVPRLVNELRRIAFNALDLETKRSLQSLLGELAR
jgi:hypothetical protein